MELSFFVSYPWSEVTCYLWLWWSRTTGINHVHAWRRQNGPYWQDFVHPKCPQLLVDEEPAWQLSVVTCGSWFSGTSTRSGPMGDCVSRASPEVSALQCHYVCVIRTSTEVPALHCHFVWNWCWMQRKSRFIFDPCDTHGFTSLCVRVCVWWMFVFCSAWF